MLALPFIEIEFNPDNHFCASKSSGAFLVKETAKIMKV